MNWTSWVLILALGIATNAMRAAFFVGYKRPLPRALQRALHFAPPAILAALAVPALVSAGRAFSLPRFIAGGVGVLVAVCSTAHPAWRSKSILLTVVSGMSALWLLTLAHF